MEYLNNIHDTTINFNENDFNMKDITGDCNYIYGLLDDELRKFNVKVTSSGSRLRFSTPAGRILLKIELDNVEEKNNIVDWNTKGFDIYDVVNGEYVHKTVFAPFDDNYIFSEIIHNKIKKEICVFLPNFAHIERIFMGVENNSPMNKEDYPDSKIPIVFYGNSIVQGASASRSSNSFPNTVSKTLNHDVMNVVSADDSFELECFKVLIRKYNNIVLVFSSDKYSNKIFKKVSSIVGEDDNVIVVVNDLKDNKNKLKYKHLLNNESISLICLSELFEKEELDVISYDENSFSDYGMYLLSQATCELIK